jgi:cyclopropane fatty-acyl-phospholipid synthase-like methyltransferase
MGLLSFTLMARQGLKTEDLVSYILQGKFEAKRLDEQTHIDQFSIESEMEGIQIPAGHHVLDAGCGSGILSRYLEAKYPNIKLSGCDLSRDSLAHAEKNKLQNESQFFHHDMVQKQFNEKYDFIFNRLVAHHLSEEGLKMALENFYHALNVNGKIHIIDVDGIFVNLGSPSKSLQNKIEMVKNKFSGNLHAARLIPSYLQHIGFKNISWKIQAMNFEGKNRSLEVAQWKERFESSLPFYEGVFGSEFEARKFFKEYTDEAAKDHIPLFCNKFLITATK